MDIEIDVLRGQCPDRRIGERDVLVSEIEVWQRQRNASGARIDSDERLSALMHKQVNHNRCNATFADLKAAICA